MDNIAVLIPCYNEAKTIRKVITDFRRVLLEARIYVYSIFVCLSLLVGLSVSNNVRRECL